ncbi:MAG: hypothetical protein ACTSX8_01445 [Alphaproteobacteria bacterium]
MGLFSGPEMPDFEPVWKVTGCSDCVKKDVEITRLAEVERQYLKAEAHLPEEFRYGLVSATFDMHQALLIARRERDDARDRANKAETRVGTSICQLCTIPELERNCQLCRCQ